MKSNESESEEDFKIQIQQILKGLNSFRFLLTKFTKQLTGIDILHVNKENGVNFLKTLHQDLQNFLNANPEGKKKLQIISQTID